MVRIAVIFATLCTSRKDEEAMKDAVLRTAAGPLASKLYRFESLKNKLTADRRRRTPTFSLDLSEHDHAIEGVVFEITSLLLSVQSY